MLNEKVWKLFQKSPTDYFREVLDVQTLQGYQNKCLQTIADNERTAIRACHDLGKTFLVAGVVPWFLSCFPYCKIITTAPTYNQVKNILWSEIRSANARAKFPIGGEINLTEWKIDDGWFAIGFTPRNEVVGAGDGQGTASSFQGFHAPGGVLVIFDEATGIPHNIWTMAEGLLTSGNVKFVAIGNPTSTASEFYQCFKSAAWAKVSLSCFDSPNLIANGITDKQKLIDEAALVKSMTEQEAKVRLDSYVVPVSYLLTTKWVISSVIKWGIDHPLTVSKILGEFPQAGDNALIPLGYVEQAQLRVNWPEASDRKILGIDVARFGSDSTEFTPLHGKKQLGRKALYKQDTVQVVGEAIAYCFEVFGGWPDIIVVDETGIGGGVVDLLRDSVPDDVMCEIRGVQFGGAVECTGPKDCKHDDATCEKSKYVNLKARMFGLLQVDMKAEDGLSLIDDVVYLEEIPTIRFQYDKKGRMQIESKDEYKKRTGRGSPDRADSLALANYGRYDELTAGTFTKTIKPNGEDPKPRAAGLGSQNGW